jgi:hypothetical protein
MLRQHAPDMQQLHCFPNQAKFKICKAAPHVPENAEMLELSTTFASAKLIPALRRGSWTMTTMCPRAAISKARGKYARPSTVGCFQELETL